MPKNNTTTSPKTTLQLTAANGSRIKTYGQKVLTVDLGLKRDFISTFVIADLGAPIISDDFIANFGLLIDLRGRKLIDTSTNITSTDNTAKTEIHTLSVLESNSSIAQSILKLITEFSDISKTNAKPFLENKSHIAHHIVTEEMTIIQRPRRLSKDKLLATKKEIQILIKMGIVRPSTSN